MKKIICIFFIVINILLLNSSYSIAQYCAPLQLDNIWVFNSYAYNRIDKYKVTDTNYIINKKSYSRIEGTSRPSRFNPADSLFYYNFQNMDYPYYKYKCSVGDTFFYYEGPNPNSRVTHAILDAYLAPVFDTILKVKIIHKNVFGLNEYYEVWTDELGLLEVWFGWDVIYRLKGCVINGRVYGDTSVTSDVEGDNIQPFNFNLSQNYPNPFNPSTEIKYSIKEKGLVTIKIYDILGNVVKTLIEENKEAGNYSVTFNATNFSSGIYFYELTVMNGSQPFRATKKMLLLK